MSAQPYRELEPYREAERDLHLVAPLAPDSQPATRQQAVVGRATIAVSTLSGVLLALALHGGHL
jgi:hypothetical protein